MLKQAFSFAGTLLLTGAAVVMMPGLSQAQHGGGHGGGGHFSGGGAHFSSGGGGGGHFANGGSHFSSGAGHFANGGSHFSGARPGGFRSGGTRLSGFRHGYGHYYGGYGFYPSYGLYGGYYPYYDGSSPYLSSSPMYDSGYSNTYGDVVPDFGYGTAPAAPATPDYQMLYPSATAPATTDYQTLYPSLTAPLHPDTPAHITVKAPADTQLRFNGTLTAATGTVREFDSPPLAAGRYSYDIEAHWTENGQDVTQTRNVEVTPGSRVEVDFPAPPRTSAG